MPSSPPLRAVQPRVEEPGRPVPPPSRDRGAAEPPLQAGDLVCGRCGSGNVPTRRYCRRCGASLADAPVVPKAPWWRRLFTRRAGRKPVAGERPPRRQWRRPRFVLPLLVLVALGAAGYAFRGEAGRAVEAVRDRTSKTEQVHATKVTASSARKQHPAALAVDGTTDKHWTPARPGAAEGEYLEATFAAPIRLLDLVVHPGSSPVAEKFLTQARPGSLSVTVTSSDGRTTVRTVRLADVPGPQRFHLPVSDAVRVRLTVRSTYGAGNERYLALAEVEFFKRR
ncbi:discoidin domain-containing protein [Streptomyces sp. NPDC048604]|uniref:discoidin domain-containing protein n=1 Tax=Streptomyces sp. NPDC048604 TaxID=3365578 RepID=UPI00372047E1